MMVLIPVAAAFAVVLWCALRYGSSRRAAPFLAAATFLFFAESTLWVASDLFTGEGFNSAVLYHLRVGLEGAGGSEYLDVWAVSIAGAIAAVVAALVVWRRAARRTDRVTGASAAALAGLFLLLVLHPSFNGFLGTFNRAIYGPESLLASLFDGKARDADGSIAFADYYRSPAPEWPESKAPRNLVVLYAESLERSYFDEARFPGLISELRELERQAVSFTNVRNVAGTGFTIAGIVASQCGMPLVTSGHPNSMRGMDRFLPGATCLGDILSARGYGLSYLGGARLSFAGKGKFFASHGFDTVLGFEELKAGLGDPDYVSGWGLYDDSLLDEFYRRFERLSAARDPFALFGLTMDTHHPSGHRSRSCGDAVYGDGANAMLNAVHCSDRLLAAVVRKILASPWADDTLLVVASDHPALKNDAWERLRAGERRNLLLVFAPGEAPRQIDVPGTTLDTPAIVAHYLGASIDAFGLGRNLAAGQESLVASLPSLSYQLRGWREAFAAFWELPDTVEQVLVAAAGTGVSVNDRDFGAPALLTLEDGALASIRFAFDSRTTLDSYVRSSPSMAQLIWVDECRNVRAMALTLPSNGHCVFAGAPGAAESVARVLDEPVDLTAQSLSALAASPPAPELLATRMRNLEALSEFGDAGTRLIRVALDDPRVEAFAVQSSGGPGARSALLTDDNVAAGGWRLGRGLHLFELAGSASPRHLVHLDPCAGDVEGEGASLARAIDARGRPEAAYLVVSSDSATCGQSLEPIFADLGLEAWTEIGLREPYVALIGASRGGVPIELRGDALTALRVEFTPARASGVAGGLPVDGT